MPPILDFVFMLVAAVLFAIAAFWNPTPPPRYSLMAAGLFFMALALLPPPL